MIFVKIINQLNMSVYVWNLTWRQNHIYSLRN